MRKKGELPVWADVFLLPLMNLICALIICGIVIYFIGENPFNALMVMIKGAFYYNGSLGYTLYYTTNFIFTGLAVAIAFHGGMFNIGGEGQGAIAGLGVAVFALYFGAMLPPLTFLPLAIIVAMLFGAFWGAIPGYLQAKRGSHIVITTIMFNFIAASILVYLLAGPLMRDGQGAPETEIFNPNTFLPRMNEMLSWIGIETTRTPLNFSFVIAILACFVVWVLIWRSKYGYELRTVGHSPDAATYAGISVSKITIMTMALSGGLAGLLAINEILGVQHKLVINFTAGYGFTGIAVALMGRNHPIGIFLASLLFGAIYQGGTELDFEFTTITREIVQLISGLIILFSGALAYMFKKPLERWFLHWQERAKA